MKSFLTLLILTSVFHLDGQISYDFDWKKDGVILGGSAFMVGSSLIIDYRREAIALDDILNARPDINSFDRFALENSSIRAKNASDALFIFSSAAPLFLLRSQHFRGREIQYLMLLGETVALNGGLTLLVKTLADRKRPYFYNSDFPIDERQSLDARKSFFSGHTSHTAAVSFFTASVFSSLYPDSKWKYAIWTGAFTIPASTAILRVQAGRHFPTDAIAGYGIGASIGLLIPYLHRKSLHRNSALKISPTLNGISLRYQI